MKDKPGEILYKGLLVRNRLANFFLQTINLLFIKRKKPSNGISYKKILVSNIAHLGDVILSTSVLNTIIVNHPQAKIHFLCGSWSRKVLENNSLIEKIYLLDHWKLNRSSRPLYRKIFKYIKDFNNLLKALSAENYDLAIDLYFYYPNTILLLSKAKIQVRVGYTSGGFGRLLTHPIEWKVKNQSVISYYLDLLQLIFPVKIEHDVKPALNYYTKGNIDHVEQILADNLVSLKNYVILQPGTGLKIKEWPIENWKSLVLILSKRNIKLIFSGYGKNEDELIRSIIEKNPNCLNLCNELEILETAYLIKNSLAVLCVDSVAGHIASAFDIPCIVIGNGINDNILWKPSSHVSHYLVNKVPCMPCYSGCLGMQCIKEIRVNSVVEILEKRILLYDN